MSKPDDLSPTYTMPMDVQTYRQLGLDQPAPWAVNGHDRYASQPSMSGEYDVDYAPCSEAQVIEGVPAGRVTSIKQWESQCYPGTRRDIRFYLSPGADVNIRDVGLMIFNDGIGYLGRKGPVRAAAVLDNLFAAGEIGPTLAVFVNPGRPVELPAEPVLQVDKNRADEARSHEYDDLRPLYGRFLLEEVIPLAEKTMACSTTNSPGRRLVAGISSGGIAAFTAAWHFPTQFGRVMSHCGSFTNIRGGHHYPYMIRTTPRKPIRVYLQSGERDIDGLFGNWPLANRMMAQSLAFAGYDHRFDFGHGGHTLAHGGARFADAIRWLLR